MTLKAMTYKGKIFKRRKIYREVFKKLAANAVYLQAFPNLHADARSGARAHTPLRHPREGLKQQPTTGE